MNCWIQAAESASAIAELAGTVKAFVSFGRRRDDNAPQERAEIWALYASPDAWDQGLGRALLAHALALLQAQGFRETSLWVLSGHARAVRFYGAAGFRPVAGSQKLFHLGGTQVEETQFLRQHGA